MVGPIIGALASSLVSGGLAEGASRLFGGRSRKAIRNLGREGDASRALANFRPTGFSGGGLQARFDAGRFDVTSGAGRQGVVSGLSNQFAQQAAAVGGLRGLVRPGFGRLTDARVRGVQNARSRAIGNLRENLSRRRILGSSFGEDAIARAEAEFGQQEAAVRAQSFVEELQLTNQLIGDQFEASRGQFQTLLGELNIQSEAALKLATGADAQLGAAARQRAVIASQDERQLALIAQKDLAGLGAGLEPGISALGEAVSNRLIGTAT